MIDQIRKMRRQVAYGAGVLAIAFAVLALGGEASPFGINLSSVEGGAARASLGVAAIASLLVAGLVGLERWPSAPPTASTIPSSPAPSLTPPPPPPPVDDGVYIDRPEREDLERSLDQERVTALTGPAGAGKSRLASEVRKRRKEGWYEEAPWHLDFSGSNGEDAVDLVLA